MSCPNYNDDVAATTGVPFEDQGWPVSGTVLVVEDEETVRLTVEKILTALLDRQDRDAPEESFELVM